MAAAKGAFETVQATLADIDVLTPLFDGYRRFYAQAGDLDAARRFIHERLALRESVIFLARDAGAREALGFTQLYPSFSSVAACRAWILNDLYVVKSARGRGVGRALMEQARAHTEATGADRLMLSTAHDNRTAQALYESLGYRRDPDYHYVLPIPTAG